LRRGNQNGSKGKSRYIPPVFTKRSGLTLLRHFQVEVAKIWQKSFEKIILSNQAPPVAQELSSRWPLNKVAGKRDQPDKK
jgi:hypothetical protein